MMYVVKVGQFYIKNLKSYNISPKDGAFYVEGVVLSREIGRNFNKKTAQIVANMTNGEVIEMEEMSTNWAGYKQLSLFDKEVTNDN